MKKKIKKNFFIMNDNSNDNKKITIHFFTFWSNNLIKSYNCYISINCRKIKINKNIADRQYDK